MSIRVMADVWDNGPDDATLTSVLVVLANSADDSGGNCFPGNALIAQRTRYSERTVIRALAELERQGWIAILQRRGGRPKRGARKHELAEYHTQYRINVAKLKGCQSVTVYEREKGDTGAGKGDIDRGKRVTPATEKGDIDDNPPHPLIGRTVTEPSVGSVSKNTPTPTPTRKRAGGSVAADLSAEEQKALARVAAACGESNPRRKRAIGRALRLYAETERMSPGEVADSMVEAWREYKADAHLMRYLWRPDKFFSAGHWRNAELWPYDHERLERERVQRRAQVGAA